MQQLTNISHLVYINPETASKGPEVPLNILQLWGNLFKNKWLH